MFGAGCAYRPIIEIIAIPMTIPAAVHTNLGILNDQSGMRASAASVQRVDGHMHTHRNTPYATASMESMVVRRAVDPCGGQKEDFFLVFLVHMLHSGQVNTREGDASQPKLWQSLVGEVDCW